MFEGMMFGRDYKQVKYVGCGNTGGGGGGGGHVENGITGSIQQSRR